MEGEEEGRKTGTEMKYPKVINITLNFSPLRDT